jgi:hypothetical protein
VVGEALPAWMLLYPTLIFIITVALWKYVTKIPVAVGLLLITGYWLGCKAEHDTNSDIPVISIDSPGLSTSNGLLDIDEMKIVKLETSEQVLLSSVSEIEIVDSLLLIKSGRELFLFDITGKFRAKVGRSGLGPGEYITMSAFCFNPFNKEVVVIDAYKYLMLRYNYDGEYIGENKLPEGSVKWASTIRQSSDGNLLIANQINKFDNAAYSLISPSESKTEHLFPFEISTGNYSYYFASNPIVATNDELHFILPFDNRIFKYSNAQFETLYMINTPQPMASKRELNQIDNFNYASYKYMADKGLFSGFTGIFETDSIILLNYLHDGTTPAFCAINKGLKKGVSYIYPTDFSKAAVPFVPIIGCYGNSVVAYSSINMLEIITGMLPDDSPYLSQFKEVAYNSSEEDNGCLIFYRFRS